MPTVIATSFAMKSHRAVWMTARGQPDVLDTVGVDGRRDGQPSEAHPFRLTITPKSTRLPLARWQARASLGWRVLWRPVLGPRHARLVSRAQAYVVTA
jgi:hypothetical protein